MCGRRRVIRVTAHPVQSNHTSSSSGSLLTDCGNAGDQEWGVNMVNADGGGGSGPE